MQLIAILAVLVAANIGVVYFGSEAYEGQDPEQEQGIVEIEEVEPATIDDLNQLEQEPESETNSPL